MTTAKATGEKTAIEVNNGEFQFDLWVPSPDPNKQIIKMRDGQMTALITEDSDSEEQTQLGFSGSCSFCDSRLVNRSRT